MFEVAAVRTWYKLWFMLNGVPFFPAVQTSRSVESSSVANRAGSCIDWEVVGTFRRLLILLNLWLKLDRSESPGIVVT